MISKRTRESFTRVILFAETEHYAPPCSPFLLPPQKCFLCAAGKKAHARSRCGVRARQSHSFEFESQNERSAFGGGKKNIYNKVDQNSRPSLSSLLCFLSWSFVCCSFSHDNAHRRGGMTRVVTWSHEEGRWGLFQEIALPRKLHSCPLVWKMGLENERELALRFHATARAFSWSSHWLSWVSSQSNGCCQLPLRVNAHSSKEFTDLAITFQLLKAIRSSKSESIWSFDSLREALL